MYKNDNKIIYFKYKFLNKIKFLITGCKPNYCNISYSCFSNHEHLIKKVKFDDFSKRIYSNLKFS